MSHLAWPWNMTRCGCYSYTAAVQAHEHGFVMLPCAVGKLANCRSRILYVAAPAWKIWSSPQEYHPTYLKMYLAARCKLLITHDMCTNPANTRRGNAMQDAGAPESVSSSFLFASLSCAGPAFFETASLSAGACSSSPALRDP